MLCALVIIDLDSHFSDRSPFDAFSQACIAAVKAMSQSADAEAFLIEPSCLRFFFVDVLPSKNCVAALT